MGRLRPAAGMMGWRGRRESERDTMIWPGGHPETGSGGHRPAGSGSRSGLGRHRVTVTATVTVRRNEKLD